MKYSSATPWRLVRERLLRLPFYEAAGTVNFTAESAGFSVASQKQKRISKAGSVRHSSTNFFCSVKKFGWNFFREELFIARIRRAVKCRDGNCRRQGAVLV
jgi:hypothetical protein